VFVTVTCERRHRSVGVTPSRWRAINSSCQSPHRQVLAVKNGYRWRQSPSTTKWSLLKITTGDSKKNLPCRRPPSWGTRMVKI